MRLMRRKLGIINSLRHEVQQLRHEAHEREESLHRFADEYVEMGDECLRMKMPEAAMKSYEKATSLCPGHQEAWKRIRKLEKANRKGNK